MSHIPVLRPLLPSADRLAPYLQQIDANRVYSNFGPLSMELGNRLGEHFGVGAGRVICASTGTAALMAGILAAAGRAQMGRHVALVPAFTFVGTALAAELCGYRVHFCDVDSDIWQLTPDLARAALEQDESIGLVLPVAPFGRPVPQAPWVEFQAKTGRPVVIDAAAAFETIAANPGAFLGDLPVALSFHATKAFATGEGGCLFVAGPSQAQRTIQALNFGFYTSRECDAFSFNGKLSEYHAAVGLAELDGWRDKSADLARVVDLYRREFRNRGLEEMLCCAPETCSSYVLACFDTVLEAAAAKERLAEADIGFRHWYGEALHRQNYYRDLSGRELPVSERLDKRIIGLPMAQDLKPRDVRRVVQALA
jgi:dTDP-4-amino-4,6-dideoxygalactose transaminase